jgi:hypothetical protein
MKISYVEVVGFICTWILLVGYFFIKIGIIPATGLLYQGINLIGSLGIIFVALKRKAKQPAILNGIWALIALVAIGRLFL